MVGRRYRKWLAEHPDKAPHASKAVLEMVGHKPSMPRAAGDHGEYIEKMDLEFHQHWMALGEWREDPEAQAFVPTADEWAEQVDYVPAATPTSSPRSGASPRRRTRARSAGKTGSG